jgi:hypothetical protein
MFVKTQTVKAESGKAYTYYRLARSYREKGEVKQDIVADLGALTAQEAAKFRPPDIARRSTATFGGIDHES